MGAVEAAQLDVGDDGGHEAGAVRLLVLAVAIGPGPAAGGRPSTVEVVVDQQLAPGRGQVGGAALGQALHELSRLGHRVVAGVTAPVALHPAEAPVAAGTGGRVGPDAVVELEDLGCGPMDEGRCLGVHPLRVGATAKLEPPEQGAELGGDRRRVGRHATPAAASRRRSAPSWGRLDGRGGKCSASQAKRAAVRAAADQRTAQHLPPCLLDLSHKVMGTTHYPEAV